MKITNYIFEEDDLVKFREKCGYFFEGDDGFYKRHELPTSSWDYREDVKKKIQLGLAISESDDEEKQLMFNHLEEEIEKKEEHIIGLQKTIRQTRKEITIRKEALEVFKKSKTFLDFFLKITN